MVKSSQLVTTVRRRQCYLDNVLSTVLKIIESDGPVPMSNFKPTKKTRTAADRFKETHQAEYEARSASSGDAIQRVHHHNSAHPKLREELDKKKSTTKVNACKTTNNSNAKSNTNKKRKTDAKEEQKKKKTFQKKPTGSNKRNRTTKRITKKRPYRKRIIELYNRSKTAGKRTCEAARVNRTGCKSANDANSTAMDVEDELVTIYSNDGNAARPRSDVSISTYNSYPSTEHEPML